jgi:hypothetical protein
LGLCLLRQVDRYCHYDGATRIKDNRVSTANRDALICDVRFGSRRWRCNPAGWNCRFALVQRQWASPMTALTAEQTSSSACQR